MNIWSVLIFIASLTVFGVSCWLWGYGTARDRWK